MEYEPPKNIYQKLLGALFFASLTFLPTDKHEPWTHARRQNMLVV